MTSGVRSLMQPLRRSERVHQSSRDPLDLLKWQARPPISTASGDFRCTPIRKARRVSRQLMIPAADTRLYAVDAAGGTPALLFLSGGFGTVHNWSRVIRRLDGKYRTVRFDARARGKSGTSADYSVQAAVDDIGRVIDATGIERPILVGWSLGATHAVRYAAQHPERVAGLVLIDGAYPITMFDEAGKEKVRTQFRRLGWMMRIMAALGRSARMSPAESADVVIEMDAVNGDLGPDFAALDCPTVFVVGTGAHSGAT